jgi:hypothetical protein
MLGVITLEACRFTGVCAKLSPLRPKLKLTMFRPKVKKKMGNLLLDIGASWLFFLSGQGG